MNMIPPHDIGAEKAVLGSCLLSGEIVASVMSELTESDFYNRAHVEIFKAISKLFSAGMNVDLITVSSQLQSTGSIENIGGIMYLSGMTDTVPMRSRVGDFCHIVIEKSRARRLITASEQMTAACYQGLPVDETVNSFGQDIAKISASGERNIEQVKNVADAVYRDMVDINNGSKTNMGVQTGFDDLDRLTGGFQKGEVTVIAGRPGMGKTTISMNIVSHAAKKGSKGLIFSLEMTRKRLVQKMISMSSGINTKGMDRGYLNDSEWPRINQAIKEIKLLPVTIDDSSALSITQIQARAKMLAIRSGLDFVLVDYLQLARAKADNREREISEISAGLKALAKDLDIPVIALSQLNRSLESRSDRRPMMSDLRDSGSIEQDAGTIIFIYRDDVYNKDHGNPLRGCVELIIPKNRYGDPGKVDLMFDGSQCKFYSVSKFDEEN